MSSFKASSDLAVGNGRKKNSFASGAPPYASDDDDDDDRAAYGSSDEESISLVSEAGARHDHHGHGTYLKSLADLMVSDFEEPDDANKKPCCA